MARNSWIAIWNDRPVGATRIAITEDATEQLDDTAVVGAQPLRAWLFLMVWRHGHGSGRPE